MKHESKQKAEEHQQLAAKSTRENVAREFATTDELLRHDAAQTEVPPVIAERLSKSIEGLPGPARSWWQRIFDR
ncbi:MAG TPA: hypothetical protein VFZ59_15100 [Verrucomicrobiae bacterium]|nr:hypothetical protein [Verrucomicrobiae bacterium]